MAVWSIVDYTDLFEGRFDPESHQPGFLETEQLVQGPLTKRLDAVAHVTDGNHVSIADEFSNEGVRYLKGGEVSDFFIADDTPTFIPAEMYKPLTRAHMQKGDVLLSVIGTIGPVALVTDKYEKLCGSCKLAIIKPHSVSSEVLAIYLSSQVGQQLLHRRIRGSVQPGVVLPDVRAFPVPFFNPSLVQDVERLVHEARQAAETAASAYPQAEAELLERLGWDEIRATPRELFYIADWDEMKTQSRADPEFFQPHYQRLREHIQKRGGLDLGSGLNSLDKGAQPDEYDPSGEIFIVKSKNVSGRGISWESCERARRIDWDSAFAARLKKDDVVFNATGRGTLGRAEALGDLPGDVLAAVDLLICRPNQEKVLPIYLALFLNSPAGLAQSEQTQTGSSGQLHLYPDHLREFQIFVPRNRDGSIDLAWQQRLSAQVLESSEAKTRAREKLEEAKALVEDAINSF